MAKTPARTTTKHMRTVTKHAAPSSGQATRAASMISVLRFPMRSCGTTPKDERPIFKKFLEYGTSDRTGTA